MCDLLWIPLASAYLEIFAPEQALSSSLVTTYEHVVSDNALMDMSCVCVALLHRLMRKRLAPGGVLAANMYSNSTALIKEMQGWMESAFPEFSFFIHLPLQMSLVGMAVNTADLRHATACCNPVALRRVAQDMVPSLPHAVVDLIKCKSFSRDWEAGARSGPMARK